MNTDDLVEMLARDAAPVRLLASPWKRTTVWLALSALPAALVVMWLSPDVSRIIRVHGPRFWVEQAAAVATAAAAAAAALISVLPGRPRSSRFLPIVPLALWAGILLWGCVRDWQTRGFDALAVHSDWPCVMAILLAGIVPALAGVVLLRRGAPLTPALTAAYGGLAVAALGSVAACLSMA